MIMFYLVASLFLMLSLIMVFLSLFFMLYNYKLFLIWSLFNYCSVGVEMYIYLDWISLLFIFTVLLISSMIFFYCCEYMWGDMNIVRFFYLIYMFVISMILMVISPSILSIILGWDGLGLISYGLIIYYQSNFSYNSGLLTVLMNRLGDIMIIISMSLIYILGGWDFVNFKSCSLGGLMLVVIAAFTKSAQFPFSSWLPAAMAAPTPVSSLVHSSTLVTAGVYLLIRFMELIYLYESYYYMFLFLGMFTMLFSGFSALYEFDFKKIIALSTLSQLGLMMVIYSEKYYILSFFHLVVHAMFKSMMFMCSGVIIHSMNEFQDIRLMGALKEFFPLTMFIFMVSNFSLCGMPFFSGFYSKDLILEKIFMNKFTLFMYLFLLISTGLTVMYSIRLCYYLMYKNLNFLVYFKVGDLKLMNYPMFILFICSLKIGSLLNWFIFMNIEEIHLMNLEKIQILLICFMSGMLMMCLIKLDFKVNMFTFFFGKMWMLYYVNFYLNLFSLLCMNKFYYLVDKGLNKFMAEDLFDSMIFKFNMKINFYYNNLLIMIMFFTVYLIFMLLLMF
uniref:NADH-ubiquinone oxidoreductase chain 5 n=1 Tax=Encyrtus infelix TaxID=355422 RepID=A0A411FRJ1_9HYME|nr:NADH dehydrogenase subunit 5 [Encyrtus infelix]